MAKSSFKKKQDSSWEPVSKWYRKHMQQDNYHHRVIYPQLADYLHELYPQKGKLSVLDIACGEGELYAVLSQIFQLDYVGVDLSTSLLNSAKNKFAKEKSVKFFEGDVQHLPKEIPDNSFDLGFCVLGLQNIADLESTLNGVGQKLKPGGHFIAVLTHPMFRVPKYSDWDYNSDKSVMYRKVWRYQSSTALPIKQSPFKTKFTGQESAVTYTYHRPLREYVKALTKAGLSLIDMAEWNSDKVSEPTNPWVEAENTAREEIPLFMMLVVKKMPQAKND